MMELRGWSYTGRNIGPDLHKQFRLMIDSLSDSALTNHSIWGNEIQDRLAVGMQVSSSGVVRTVKSACMNFGLLKEASFNGGNEMDTSNLLTYRGKLVYYAAKLEEQVELSDHYDDAVKGKIYAEIKKLYEEAYCDALRFYYFKNSDGSSLHPLRATLRALNKFGHMDKWEWYLLNTCIRHDDCDAEEAVLADCITRYRNGELHFTMQNVIENPKGHQYIPQHFEFAGLLHVVRRPEWSICDSGRHMEVKAEVLEVDFLEKLYGGSL